MNDRYICPDHSNPAEFLADLISIDYSSAESVNASQKRIDALIESFAEQRSLTLYVTSLTPMDSTNSRKKTIRKSKGGWWRQFRLLLKRAWLQVNIISCREINLHLLASYIVKRT